MRTNRYDTRSSHPISIPLNQKPGFDSVKPWCCQGFFPPASLASGRREAGDGVGHGHERRVQRVRHAPDGLVPRGTSEAEGVQHGDEAWRPRAPQGPLKGPL